MKHLKVNLFASELSGLLYRHFADGTGMLQSLRSLTLDHSIGPAIFNPPVILPKLERFAVVYSHGFDHRLAVQFIESHTATLNSVLFTDVYLSISDVDDKAPGLLLLESARALCSEALIEISTPAILEKMAYVSFSPPPKEFDSEADPLDVFIGVKDCLESLHYSTKPSKLQASLDFMIGNYKELITEQEEFEYGAASGVDSDEDEEEEEDEDEEEYFDQVAHDEEMYERGAADRMDRLYDIHDDDWC